MAISRSASVLGKWEALARLADAIAAACTVTIGEKPPTYRLVAVE
ncbi:hypothetical protein SAMN04487974_13111 [Pelagibacterium luteolum]|uniref:Uncharacterized protein n=1 Tax=Pelagibacterium luteolum TaxID=440168 RepID=A0A1G8AIW4_9HYPH|nr:hypothetical protein SAMN04487974_13111 [Pelagibacterium luteolum]